MFHFLEWVWQELIPSRNSLGSATLFPTNYPTESWMSMCCGQDCAQGKLVIFLVTMYALNRCDSLNSGDSYFSLQVGALERSHLKCLHILISVLGVECAVNTTQSVLMRSDVWVDKFCFTLSPFKKFLTLEMSPLFTSEDTVSKPAILVCRISAKAQLGPAHVVLQK